MIPLLAFDARRIFRRRPSLIVLVAPLVLVIWRAIAGSVPSHAVAVVLLASTAFVFVQTLLSDREGSFDLVTQAAPTPRWLPTARLVLLGAIPFCIQVVVYRLCLSVFRLG